MMMCEPLNISIKLSRLWRENNFEAIKQYIDLPWDLAVLERNSVTIRNLAENNSIPMNYQNLRGITLPMLTADKRSDARGARLLHEYDTRTGFWDKEGRMALHYAANSGNAELLEYVLQHTDKSRIERWFMNIPNVLQENGTLYSLVAYAFYSRNERCLEILLSSEKLSKSILQAPFIVREGNPTMYRVYSPVACILNFIGVKDEKRKSFLQLLLTHKIIMLDEFFKVHNMKWINDPITYENPFSGIIHESFSVLQHYFNWLKENDVTIDYCLQCYHDNTQPFATFTDYRHYYEPVLDVLLHAKLEALKLFMSNSAILEPDVLIIQYHARLKDQPLYNIIQIVSHGLLTENPENRENVYNYLISLKPMFYQQLPPCEGIDGDELFFRPYTTKGEELSKSTLQQLCRTAIRHHIRKNTLRENLSDFRKNILELPLPAAMKKFLLFQS